MHRPKWPWDQSALTFWTSCFLLGVAASLGTAGLSLNLNNLLLSPYAPNILAIHLLPLAMVVPLALGSLGPAMLSSHLGSRTPDPNSATVGIVGLATGICTALLPLALSSADSFAYWMHAHFVLSNWMLRILQLVLMLLVCTLPLAGMGFIGRLIPSMEHRNRDCSRPAVRPALWLGVLTGIGAGILVAIVLASRPATLLPAASLPMLILAVISGKMPDVCSETPATKPT